MSLSNPSDWDRTAAEYAQIPIQGPMYIPCTRMLEAMNNARSFSTASTTLDIGSGPGTVATLLFKNYGKHIPQTAKLIATDFSQGMVEAARMRKELEANSEDVHSAGCWARLELDVMDAQNLEKIATGSVSHITGSMVYFMLPDHKKGLSEAHRVLSDDGVFACTSWAKVGWMEFLTQAACKASKKTAPSVALPTIWKTTEGIKGEMEAAGFRGVHTEYVEALWHIPEPKKAVVAFTRSSNPGTEMIIKGLSEEELAVCRDEWVKLVEENGNVCKGIAVLGLGRK
ncbi:hypothetical protein TSTA_098210 [Talaromyces stipitatus ATCC 10500]|uniref:Methyltransferase type 11 domain-containing protein n=1 Tax=Talaromyces stipitatus (strain ATCC 10500 / CBS 375.48 / QM 6759 / NRRL 1006) TaxID=441959 RepID=B8MM52_TALSN|nr:uncharacterized protein TSTA_098210 [Talaromyces stipitatus ATCC 10500]EED13564.1 hypothetical protein TSTA_098210 [Talaromyces stipitatus ATCC 10500]